MTPLDQAHNAMEAAPEDQAARLRFYERLMDGELCLLLETEPTGDQIKPDLFEVDGISYALVFDREERLSAFTQSVSPHLSSAGRQIVTMFAGHGIGLGVNLGADSAILIPPDAVEWMVSQVQSNVVDGEETPVEVSLPTDLPESLLRGLDAKLAAMQGLADCAYLAQCTYRSGQTSHVLGFVDANEDAQGAIANAIAEMLNFSGLEAAALDVVFLKNNTSVVAALRENGLRFDIPKINQRTVETLGSNPDKPPILR